MEHLLAERVKEIMEDQEYSPSGFADTIDVPRPIISHILSGRNKPSLDVIQKILMRFPELNPWWLLTGKGQMKQLNLFSEEELESVSIKPNTTIQNHHSTPSPVAVNDRVEKELSAAIPVSPVSAESPVAPKVEQQPVTALPPQQPHAVPNPAHPPVEMFSQALASGKTIEKMVVFYSDKTFSVYHPE